MMKKAIEMTENILRNILKRYFAEDESEAEQIVEKLCKEQHMNVPTMVLLIGKMRNNETNNTL